MQLLHHTGIPANSKFLEGHFPDNPIVPGAVLLAFSARALTEHGCEVKRIQRMKFLRQLLPEQPFEIRLERGDKLSKLVWHSAGDTLAEAQVVLGACDG